MVKSHENSTRWCIYISQKIAQLACYIPPTALSPRTGANNLYTHTLTHTHKESHKDTRRAAALYTIMPRRRLDAFWNRFTRADIHAGRLPPPPTFAGSGGSPLLSRLLLSLSLSLVRLIIDRERERGASTDRARITSVELYGIERGIPRCVSKMLFRYWNVWNALQADAMSSTTRGAWWFDDDVARHCSARLW